MWTLERPWNFTAPLSDMIKLQEEMTNVLVPALEAITPGSGCYLNEVLLFSSFPLPHPPLSHRIKTI